MQRLALALLVLGSSVEVRAEKALVISTLPFDEAAEQRAVFGVLSDLLADALGRPVKFEAAKSYSDVIDKLERGKIDVGFIGAASYVTARRSGNIRAVLRTIRRRNTSYYGIVVVKKDSPVKKLTDLKGKKFAFVDRSSSAGFLFPSILLKKAGLNVEKDLQVTFAGSHRAVVEMVAAGEADAGACFEGAQDTIENPDAVSPIARTEPVPGDPVVVRAGLGKDLIKQLRSSLIRLAGDPEAQTFFTFAEIDGFLPAVDSDYDRVADLMRKYGG